VSSVSICTQFTCFTGTTVQILTLLSSVAEEGGYRKGRDPSYVLNRMTTGLPLKTLIFLLQYA
jgi:hypothetical protein